jgi:tetratricopeptide (TPR) repeat protein
MTARLGPWAAGVVALYAAVAGFHTLADFDVWWQLASGRHLWTTGTLAAEEVFSYTARGAPWIYPPGSGLVFYGLYQAGGYTLLSLLSPVATALTAASVLLAARPPTLTAAWIAALAIPSIAWRTAVRADLFTTVLFAVLLVTLYPNGEPKRPWLLPLALLLWANLHPGFVIGLALLAFFTLKRPGLWPWTLLSAAATLVNPFGWRLYEAVWTQSRALEYQKAFIGEWGSLRPTVEQALTVLYPRHPAAGFWLLLAAAAIAAAAGLYRRQWWPVALLGAMAAACFVFTRFQALFAITAVVTAPDLLPAIRLRHRLAPASGQKPPFGWMPAAAFLALLAFAGWRSADLATNHAYLTDSDLNSFGTGIAPWYPERAVRFIRDNRLPRQLYHDYNLGGYLTWALAPEYPVFIDGRALPYGADLFFKQQRLGGLGPQSPEWAAALDHWEISTLLISTHRYGGYGAAPLKAFCDRSPFRLVYLDETAAVLVRGEDRLPAVDYHTVTLQAPPPSAPWVERFNFLADAGKLYYLFERDAEAERAWTEAARIFPGDPSLHLDLGQLRHAQGRLPEAEAEFRQAIALRPSPIFWYALGDLLYRQQRYAEAADCFGRAAGLAASPHQNHRVRAEALLSAGRPAEALRSAERALAASPYHGPAAVLDFGFTARALTVRGLAQLGLTDFGGAIATLERAVEARPPDPRTAIRIQLGLTEAFLGAARPAEARRAFDRAVALGAQGPAVEQLRQRLGPGPE